MTNYNDRLARRFAAFEREQQQTQRQYEQQWQKLGQGNVKAGKRDTNAQAQQAANNGKAKLIKRGNNGCHR